MLETPILVCLRYCLSVSPCPPSVPVPVPAFQACRTVLFWVLDAQGPVLNSFATSLGVPYCSLSLCRRNRHSKYEITLWGPKHQTQICEKSHFGGQEARTAVKSDTYRRACFALCSWPGTRFEAVFSPDNTLPWSPQGSRRKWGRKGREQLLRAPPMEMGNRRRPSRISTCGKRARGDTAPHYLGSSWPCWASCGRSV